MALFENGELANNSYLNNHGRGIFLFFCFAFCFFPGSWWLLWLLWLLRSWLLVAPGGSWWLLLVAPLAPGGYCGFRSSWWLLVASVASMASMALGSYSSSLLWLIYHLSESINQSISETCSPGACCALDTPWVSSIHPSTHPASQPAIHPSLYFYISISIYIYIYISISISIFISISIYLAIYFVLYIYIYILYLYLHLHLHLFLYLYLYLSTRFALSARWKLSARWNSNPKPALNQARIYSTPTLYKEILNQHGDSIQWNYCASLCLNLQSTCFQGACRVVT